MAIFDALTGKSQQEAANLARIAAANAEKKNTGFIDTGLNNSLAALGTAQTGATGAVNQGYADATGYLNNANAAFDPLKGLGDKYGGASTMALNALGVNGQPGQDAARAAFTAGPAYNFNLDQGLEAINRRRAAGGMLNSGNADRDAQVFGAGLASNEYNTWMNNLLGFTNPELAATGGAATGIANNERTGAGLATARGGMLADLEKWYGGGVSALEQGAVGQRTGNVNRTTDAYINSFNREADAKTAASGNMLNLGMNLAKLGVGAATGGLSGMIPGMGGGSFAGLGGNPNMPLAGFDQSGAYYNFG